MAVKTTSRVRRAVIDGQSRDTANATINRRLAVLRRAFTLGQCDPPKVGNVPGLPTLREDNARQGFFERGQFVRLLEELPDAGLRDFCEWAYWTGMRKGEIASLTWAAFDRETWTLRLHGKDSKSGMGRKLVLAGHLRVILERRVRARRLGSALIFHRAGEPVREFRKTWRSACRAAHVEGRTFHDLRRTGIRNLIRAGVSQQVAMAISGHQTASVFRRYDTTSEQDLRNAAELVTAYVESLPTKTSVTSMLRGSSE